MLGSLFAAFDYFRRSPEPSVPTQQAPDYMLTDPSPAVVFSSPVVTRVNPYARLHRELRSLYTEVEVKRLLAPLENPGAFLTSEAWFNDELVNNYFQQLAKQHPHVSVISSLMGGCTPPLPERLRSSSRYSEFKGQLSESPLVFWPIHQDSHWYLVVIDNASTDKSNVYMLDGFNSKDINLWNKYGFELATAIRPKLSSEQIIGEFINVAKQQNYYDCGPLICFYAKLIAEFYARHKELPEISVLNTSEVDYTSFRKNIGDTLIEHGHTSRSGSYVSRRPKL